MSLCTFLPFESPLLLAATFMVRGGGGGGGGRFGAGLPVEDLETESAEEGATVDLFGVEGFGGALLSRLNAKDFGFGGTLSFVF